MRFKYGLLTYVIILILFGNFFLYDTTILFGTKGFILGIEVINLVYIIAIYMFILYLHTPIKIELFEDNIRITYPRSVVRVHYCDIKTMELGKRFFKSPYLIIEFRDSPSKLYLTSFVVPPGILLQIYEEYNRFKKRCEGEYDCRDD